MMNPRPKIWCLGVRYDYTWVIRVIRTSKVLTVASLDHAMNQSRQIALHPNEVRTWNDLVHNATHTYSTLAFSKCNTCRWTLALLIPSRGTSSHMSSAGMGAPLVRMSTRGFDWGCCLADTKNPCGICEEFTVISTVEYCSPIARANANANANANVHPQYALHWSANCRSTNKEGGEWKSSNNRGDGSHMKCKHCGNSGQTIDKCYGRLRDMGAAARLTVSSDPKSDASQSLSYTASSHVFTYTTNPYCWFRCNSPYLPIGWLIRHVLNERHPTSFAPLLLKALNYFAKTQGCTYTPSTTLLSDIPPSQSHHTRKQISAL